MIIGSSSSSGRAAAGRRGCRIIKEIIKIKKYKIYNNNKDNLKKKKENEKQKKKKKRKMKNKKRK